MQPDASARQRRLLQAVDPADGQSVLKQLSPAPVIRGAGPDGFDYVCGACHQTILIENVTEGQVWDVVCRCFACGRLSSTPPLPPEVLLPNNTVMAPSGEGMMDAPLEITCGHVIVGEDALKKRASETIPAWQRESGPASSSNWHQSLENRARKLLEESFDSLSASDRRGRVSKTPPEERHRLMELLERASAASVDVAAITELHLSLSLLEGWRSDPAWEEISAPLKDPRNFPHAIITLGAARCLSRVGNAVGLHVEKQSGKRKRAADLRIAATLNHRLAIEVKAPKALRTNRVVLNEDSAREIVKDALKKAGTEEGGQLSPEHPGILLIGGFHLSERQLYLLEQAATKILAEKGGRKRHIAGVAIFSVGVLLDTAFSISIRPEWLSGNSLSYANFGFRFAQNPRYEGKTEIVTVNPHSASMS